MDVNFDSVFKDSIIAEISSFSKDDVSFREDLVNGAKLVGIPRTNQSVANVLNNRIMFFLNECKKYNVMFPVNYLIAYDLTIYFQHLYYERLSTSVDEVNDAIHAYTSCSFIKRLLNNKYYINLRLAIEKAIVEYNKVADDIYNFDIKENLDSIFEYIFQDKDNEEQGNIKDYYQAYIDKVENNKKRD